jgi:hypothetical protein
MDNKRHGHAPRTVLSLSDGSGRPSDDEYALDMTVKPIAPEELHPIETWTHLYRVGFWKQQTPPPQSGTRPEDAAWGVELWDLRAEDVHEVIAWADEKAGPDQIYTLYIRLENGHAPGEDLLVQIAGADPTRNPPFTDEFRRQHPLGERD